MIYSIPTKSASPEYWAMYKSLRRTIFRRPRCGSECMFIQLSKKIGAKVFMYKQEAIETCNRQKRGYRYGIAPKVLANVRKCFIDNLRKYDDDNDVFDNCDDSDNKFNYGYFYLTEVADIERDYGDGEFKELATKMERHKFEIDDLDGRNVGWIGRRLVCLDWGQLTVT